MIGLDDLLAPISREAFLRDHYRKQPIVIPASTLREGIFSYAAFNDMLAQTAIWTPATLKVWIDRMAVPAARYCTMTPTLNGEELRPDPEKIRAWMARGASVILNGAETLTSQFRAVAATLERAFSGYAVANIYFSFGAHQAFDSHYDDHEVFAMQIAGEKVWRVYAGRLDNPVGQPQQGPNVQAMHDRAKGAVLFEHRLAPGELIYIPRGQYHDALATTSASLHVTFSVQPLTGLALLDALTKEAARESAFRDDLPASEDALAGRLAELGVRLTEMSRSGDVLKRVLEAQRARVRPRGEFSLPERPATTRYALVSPNLRVGQAGDVCVITNGRDQAKFAPDMVSVCQWMVAASDFTLLEARAQFPWTPERDMIALLDSLTAANIFTAHPTTD